MASPIFDNLNKELSITLLDPVVAAANNGVIYTSNFRSHLLNKAQSTLWNFLYNTNKKLFYESNSRLWRFQDFVTYIGLTSDANAKLDMTSVALSIAGEVVEVLQVSCSAPPKSIAIIDQSMFVHGQSDEVQNVASEASPQGHLYKSGGSLGFYVKPVTPYASKAFLVAYLRSPSYSLSVAGSTDLEWNSTFFEDLKQLALAQSLLYDGNKTGYDLILNTVFQQYLPEIQEQIQKAVKR